DAGAGKRDLHHVLREVTGRMEHVLVGRCDIAPGSVVVRAEVGRHATAFSSRQQQRKIDLSSMIDDRLRGFDHHFKLQTALGKFGLFFELSKQADKCRHLFRNRDLRERNNKVVRQRAFVEIDKRGDKNFERAKTASTQLLVEWLDANTDERRQTSTLAAFSRFSSG